jgi:hypothetical protein
LEDIVDEAHVTLRKFSSRERSSLLAYLLVMEDSGLGSRLEGKARDTFKGLIKECSQAWESVMMYPRSTNRVNDEVERILNKLCSTSNTTASMLHAMNATVVTERKKTEDGLFVVDLALHFEVPGEGEKKVAVLVDGSPQFPSGTGGVVLQRRLLSTRGYAGVISVISRRWDRKGEEGGDQAQQQYIVNLLRDVGIDVSVPVQPTSDDFISLIEAS